MNLWMLRRNLPPRFDRLRQRTPSAFTVRQISATHVLDRWILSRLNQLIQETTAGFETYELDSATRPLMEFVDDLSNWYVRRSRDRFKVRGKDTSQALATLRRVLYLLSHLLAPSMPFFAEYLYQAMKGADDEESVHLCNWPREMPVDLPLIAHMREARNIASQALQLREKDGLKIRQPLAKLAVRRLVINPELLELIADEINVKEIVEDTTLGQDLWLDTELTPELREEGILRNLIRRVQEWRKEQGLKITDRPRYTMILNSEEAAVEKKYRTQILEATGLESLEPKN